MLPWYPSDYLASDAHAEQTLEAQGGYRNLLDRMWLSGRCRLPADDERLRALAGATVEEWGRIATAVRSQFIATKGAELTHERLLFEWRKSKSLRLARRRGAKKTNKSRWGNEKDRHASDSLSDRRASAQRSPPSPSPSPSPEGNGSPPNPPSGGNGAGAFDEALRYAAERKLPADDRMKQKLIRGWLNAHVPLDQVLKRIENGEHCKPVPLG